MQNEFEKIMIALNSTLLNCCFKMLMVLIELIVYFIKGQKGPIWTYVIYLGQYPETVHAVTNVCMKHIY